MAGPRLSEDGVAFLAQATLGVFAWFLCTCENASHLQQTSHPGTWWRCAGSSPWNLCPLVQSSAPALAIPGAPHSHPSSSRPSWLGCCCPLGSSLLSVTLVPGIPETGTRRLLHPLHACAPASHILAGSQCLSFRLVIFVSVCTSRKIHFPISRCLFRPASDVFSLIELKDVISFVSLKKAVLALLCYEKTLPFPPVCRIALLL